MQESFPHYLVITAGSNGDIYPFVALARSLQAIDRQVTFITSTFHANLVRSAGIDCLGFGTDEDYLRVVKNPDLWHPRKGFSVLFANYREHLQQMEGAIRSLGNRGPLIAIAHPLAIAGAAIGRECGLIKSIVAAYLAPSNIKTCHGPLQIGPHSVPRWVPVSWRRALWRWLEKGWIDPVPLAEINAVREGLSLPTVDSFLGHLAAAADLSVTLFPSWFGPSMPDWPSPMVLGDFPLFDASTADGFSDELSAFLASGDKPVVFTAGTGNIFAADFFACGLAAVAKLGRRAIFLTREGRQVPAGLPASVLWQPYVPLSALLPHAAALVHHGGIGTTAEALRSAPPQLITPFAWDQFDNAARVAALGAGMVLPAARLRPNRLADGLDALTRGDTFAARCSLLASRFSPAHDLKALCRQVERLVWSKREAA
ncbi:MAG: nucleotide disphospho-sugar-binding domain-containing protein [Rhodocyclaceae bacterium]